MNRQHYYLLFSHSDLELSLTTGPGKIVESAVRTEQVTWKYTTPKKYSKLEH